MSSLLEQAIVDAKALKEAAIKNAETMVIEKYSDQIKEAVSALLEQEDEEDPLAGLEEPAGDDLAGGLDDLGGDLGGDLGAELGGEEEEEKDPSLEQIPSAAADDIPEQPGSDSEKVTFELPDLVQKIKEIEAEEGAPPAPEETHQELASDDVIQSAAETSPEAASTMTEDFDLEDFLVDEIMERLKVDIEPVKSGWAGTPESQMEENDDMAIARESDDEVKEENEALRNRVAELEESIKISKASENKLSKRNDEFRDAVLFLKEKIDNVNVSNAKLLYINRSLEDSSLNERQKRKIVEAISKAETVQEAKVIYETLQSTVGSTDKKSMPKSLSEAVSRNPSLIINSRRNDVDNNTSDIFAERMQRLAGIKKNKQ